MVCCVCWVHNNKTEAIVVHHEETVVKSVSNGTTNEMKILPSMPTKNEEETTTTVGSTTMALSPVAVTWGWFPDEPVYSWDSSLPTSSSTDSLTTTAMAHDGHAPTAAAMAHDDGYAPAAIVTEPSVVAVHDTIVIAAPAPTRQEEPSVIVPLSSQEKRQMMMTVVAAAAATEIGQSPPTPRVVDLSSLRAGRRMLAVTAPRRIPQTEDNVEALAALCLQDLHVLLAEVEEEEKNKHISMVPVACPPPPPLPPMTMTMVSQTSEDYPQATLIEPPMMMTHNLGLSRRGVPRQSQRWDTWDGGNEASAPGLMWA